MDTRNFDSNSMTLINDALNSQIAKLKYRETEVGLTEAEKAQLQTLSNALEQASTKVTPIVFGYQLCGVLTRMLLLRGTEDCKGLARRLPSNGNQPANLTDSDIRIITLMMDYLRDYIVNRVYDFNILVEQLPLYDILVEEPPIGLLGSDSAKRNYDKELRCECGSSLVLAETISTENHPSGVSIIRRRYRCPSCDKIGVVELTTGVLKIAIKGDR